jgi:hypothetical protein
MKISPIIAAALVAVTGVAAAATPVLALDHSTFFDGAYYVTQLRYDGINAIAADEVNSAVFRATVQLPNGQQTFAFFDRDSLQQIKH